MLRLLGGCMIFSGSLGLGVWYREQWRIRLRTLRMLQEILELMMSEVRFGRATLPECCLSLSKRVPEPFASSFLDIYETMEKNTGISFGMVFVQRMEECLQSFPVTGEDRRSFFHFAEGEGAVEGSMQLRLLEQGREQLQGLIREQEQELNAKSRMALGLGGMSGLLLIIILL